MLPLEGFFYDQMVSAQRMLHADDAYWSGYALGLLNRYCGDQVPVTKWHESLLTPANNAAIACGYREGVRVMAEADARVATHPAATTRERANSPCFIEAG